MRATEAPLGTMAMPPGRRCRCVTLAAGECGVKDQVSRTQPQLASRPVCRLDRGSDRYNRPFMSVFTKVLRAGEGKKVRRLQELVTPINDLEPEMQALTDDALAHKTVEFRERLAQGETLDDLAI